MMDERPLSIFTVPGRLYRVHAWDNDRFSAQKWASDRREFTDQYGKRCWIRVEIRFDDHCRNGHNDFAITGDGKVIGMGPGGEFGGCCHDEIAIAFPELKPLIKWHLCSSDGPMHYLSNTLYLAGDRDYNGRRKGEPRAWKNSLRFGNFPITTIVTSRFWQWLKTARLSDMEIERVDYTASNGYQYDPKYKPKGYEAKWHECPWDNFNEALEMTEAIKNYEVDFVSVPTAYSEGKERELDAARSVAVWPEATDEELCLPREDLKALLEARLPKLLEDFEATIRATGLAWKPSELKQD